MTGRNVINCARQLTHKMEKVSFGSDVPGYIYGPRDAPSVVLLQVYSTVGAGREHASHASFLEDLLDLGLGDLDECTYLTRLAMLQRASRSRSVFK